MVIPDFAIKRPIVTTVIMLALAVFGIFALALLNTDEFPDVQNPVVVVSVPYPGASPESVEREVIDRIEEGIAGISGVDKIQSNSLDGYGVIITFFQFEKDLQEATQEIRDKISEIRNELPAEMEEPILTRFNPADLPIMSLVLSSKQMAGPELTRLADPEITRRLRGIPGVAEVEVVGGVERELTVELRPLDLQAAGLSVAEVVQALQSQNLAAPVGRLNGRFEERTIRLLGRLEKPADFARLPIAQSQGRVIRLGDVATARDGTEEPRSAAVFNGEEAVGIDVKKAKGFSTTQVASAVRDQVERIQSSLPEGVAFRVVRDAGVRVADSVRNVQEALIEGAALTVLVVFLFLNSWRSTVITGLALPVSVLASFVAVLAFGFTLNTMSLLGLSLAIGILIDDAIVVRENIVRHVEMGKDHYTAAHEGTNEIGLAVAATTFSIVVVFVPIAFMGGIAEQWFAPFALTIACSVLVSLFVSFSLDPMLSAYWPDPHVPPDQRFFITRWLDRFNAWFDRQADAYKRCDRLGARPSLEDGGARGRLVRRRSRPPGPRHRRRRVLPGHRRIGVQHLARHAAGIEPRLHEGEGGGGRADRAIEAGGDLHLLDDRRPDRIGGRRHGLRAAEAEARARAEPERRGRGAARRADAAGRGDRVDHHERLRRSEADPDPDHGA